MAPAMCHVLAGLQRRLLCPGLKELFLTLSLALAAARTLHLF